MAPTKKARIRTFKTGATRDTDNDKLKIEGFIDPLVDARYAVYMHDHRKPSDGILRDPDNWQKGIPLNAYADSLVRHMLDFRLLHDGFLTVANESDMEKVLCAVIFNARGYLYEVLKRHILCIPYESLLETANAKPKRKS